MTDTPAEAQAPLRARMLAVLDHAVETGRLTREEAFRVLDVIDQPVAPARPSGWEMAQDYCRVQHPERMAVRGNTACTLCVGVASRVAQSAAANDARRA